MSTLSNQDIRAKVLQDLYNRKQKGMEILTRPEDYAKLLGTSYEVANFNIQYLIDAGLVRGRSLGSMGTTKKECFVNDLTSFGIEAVEGKGGQDLAVNFSIINVNAPVTDSQIAIGEKINQTQSLGPKTIDNLVRFLEQNFKSAIAEDLKKQLHELEGQIEADSVRPSTLSKIKDIAQNLGPTALVVIEVIEKLLGLSLKS
ncbi:hypothetical protein MUP79_08295 [Candidatus Bathyarchaeota archaeon]|nr:hypothetical protein [Candidatus Bathyarchaeota archaeon]